MFLIVTTNTVAQTNDQQLEKIISFDSQIVVNTNNSIDVTETIVYDSGTSERHGIYRDLNLVSSQKRLMTIENIKIFDQENNFYSYETIASKKNLRLKIGDPNVTFSGQKTYIIKYRATKAVGQFDSFDEIYWNATGNKWNMPIEKASANVFLPNNTKATQTACYYGPLGSTNSCNTETMGGLYYFNSPEYLNSNEGLTVAVGFDKNIVSAYTFKDNFEDLIKKIIAWLFAIAITLLTFIVCYRWWKKNGKDPLGKGVIVPQYQAPKNVTPIEVHGIVKESISFRSLPAEIIYLATKGYLHITQLADDDFQITLLKNPSDLENKYDIKIVNSFFDNKEINASVKLSDLKEKYYLKLKPIINDALDSLLKKKFYKNLGRMKIDSIKISIALFILLWPFGFIFGLVGADLFNGDVVPALFASLASLFIFATFYIISPAKTDAGVAMKEYLLGLKYYLKIAEKERLEFHNAPEKTPAVFEELLPYAMALDVADIWLKEFDGILVTPPTWYSTNNNTAFNSLLFTQSLNNFSTSTLSNLAPPSSSGGSSGGGYSGGGGGGGGGGSW